MTQHQTPQPFYLVDPPKPSAKRSWAFPIFIGVVTLGLSVIAFGFVAGSQDSTPRPVSTASPSPSPSVTPSPAQNTSKAQPAKAEAAATLPPLTFARINCPVDSVVNFRVEPGQHSRILDALRSQEIVELTGQATESWTQVRYRDYTGWIATQHLEQLTNGQ